MAGLFGSTGTVIVGRVNDPPKSGYSDVRVDRKTIFGNKYPISETGSRKKSCALYDAYAERRMQKKGKYWKRIMELRTRYLRGENLRLTCHCWPKQCHAQTVRRMIMRAD